MLTADETKTKQQFSETKTQKSCCTEWRFTKFEIRRRHHVICTKGRKKAFGVIAILRRRRQRHVTRPSGPPAR